MVLDKVPQSPPRAWKLGTGKSYRVVNVVLVLKIMVLDMMLTKGSDIIYHTNTIAYDIKHIGHSYLVRPPASHDEMISYSFKWYHVAVPSFDSACLTLRVEEKAGVVIISMLFVFIIHIKSWEWFRGSRTGGSLALWTTYTFIQKAFASCILGTAGLCQKTHLLGWNSVHTICFAYLGDEKHQASRFSTSFN